MKAVEWILIMKVFNPSCGLYSFKNKLLVKRACCKSNLNLKSMRWKQARSLEKCKHLNIVSPMLENEKHQGKAWIQFEISWDVQGSEWRWDIARLLGKIAFLNGKSSFPDNRRLVFLMLNSYKTKHCDKIKNKNLKFAVSYCLSNVK